MSERQYLQSVTRDRTKVGSSYAFSIPAIRTLETLSFNTNVTFFIGENGSGKSTLLEAIALLMGFSAQGGTKNVRLHDDGGESGLQNYLTARRSFPKPSWALHIG